VPPYSPEVPLLPSDLASVLTDAALDKHWPNVTPNYTFWVAVSNEDPHDYLHQNAPPERQR
jgi:hypothetical protein